ncbi:putative DnaJ domain protein [Aspergillus venezuelensis]
MSDSTDLYELLGVGREASPSEIKSAYRKAALRSHPDKFPEEEREEASANFQNIQQAYEILSDDDKRHLYDTHGMGAFNGSGEPGMNGGVDLDDILAQMFGGMGGMGGGMPGMGGMGGMPPKPRQSPDEEQKYEISLEDLYKGKTVKFASTKNVICSHCKGRGGKEKATAKQCSTCQGQGLREVLTQRGAFLTKSTVVCSTCSGDGQFYATKDKCKKCKGKKTNEEKKMLEIYIPRGAKDGDRIVLEGEADQVPGQEPGDIIFQLEEGEHPVFQRAGADLKATIDITLAESLTGFSRVVIKHLDGRGIELQHPNPNSKNKSPTLSPGQILKVPGEGMPIKRSDAKGDLYLIVNVKFPGADWKPTPDVLEKLKEMLPKPDPRIKAEPVDEVEYEAKKDLEEFGSKDPAGGDAWEDDEEEGGAQCTTQ